MTTPTNATPEQRRAAWLDLMQRLEIEAGARYSLAYASLERGKAYGDDNPYPHLLQEAEAEMWAAKKILDTLKALPAPEIPVDHSKNQVTIEEAIDASDA